MPDAHAGWGIPITRQKTEYEKTSYFKQDGYPAPRPWYPLPGNLSHEIVPTLRAGYVYDHLGALFIHRHSLVDSTPGGDRLADVLGDPDKINLLVSFDVEIGDTSRYADFVLPDKHYLERFSQEPIYPNQQYQLIQLGQPAVRAYEGPRRWRTCTWTSWSASGCRAWARAPCRWARTATAARRRFRTSTTTG